MLSSTDLYFKELFNVKEELLELGDEVMAELGRPFAEADSIGEYNQLKVLNAFQRNKLSDAHFSGTTGYGYNDLGREAIEDIYAGIFNAESALVRPQMISGTHALTVALFGNLRHGDELLLPAGKPYDTLQGVIGMRSTRGSLHEHGISHRLVELADGTFDYEAIEKAINKKTKLALIQRSRGYSLRPAFTVSQISELIAFIKSIDKSIICMVDNCYGEFVERSEPSDCGADLVVGSLIKNPGGGLAPAGGYIVGKEEYVENAAARLTAPGLGKEVGPTLGTSNAFLQGLFFAPNVVSGCVKGAVFASRLFQRLGYEVFPKPLDKRSDIVQAINLKSEENVLSFCRGIQSAAPVDAHVTPEPSDMPGYDSKIIMAAGTFVQGSSIELSADAPVKPPYTVYLQGGLTFAHAKYGILIAANRIPEQKF